MSILTRLIGHRTSTPTSTPTPAPEPASEPAPLTLVHDRTVFLPDGEVSAYIRRLNAQGRTVVSSAPVPDGFEVTTGHYCSGRACGACAGVRPVTA